MRSVREYHFPLIFEGLYMEMHRCEMDLLSNALVAPNSVHLVGLENTNVEVLRSSRVANPMAMFSE